MDFEFYIIYKEAYQNDNNIYRFIRWCIKHLIYQNNKKYQFDK
jgi:hypothetical protein